MLDLEDLDRWLERGIMVIVLLVTAFAALALGAVRATEFVWVAGGTGLALALWVIRLWIGEGHRFLLHPVVWAVLAFTGYAIWGYRHAPVEYPARLELMRILVYTAFFVVALHNLHRQESLQWVTAALAVIGVFVSLYAVIQLASGSDRVWFFDRPRNYLHRGGGTFINPNHLAGLLVVVLPMAAVQVFVGRTSAVIKVLYGYAAVAMLAGIGVSMSRGGWMAAAIVLTLMMAWLLRRRQHRIPAILASVILMGSGWYYFTRFETARGRLQGAVVEGSIHSGHSRQYLMGPTLRMWLDHPGLGAGPGQFDALFPRYRPPTLQLAPGHAHNEYLELLAEHGIVGAVIVAAGLGILGWGVWRTSRFVERGVKELGFKPSNRTAYFVGASLGVSGYLVHCGVEFLFRIPGVTLALLLVSATLASNIRFATERFWLTPRWWSAAIATGLAACWLAWMLPLSLRGWREGRLLNAAARSEQVDETLLDTLKKAHAIEPANPRTAYELGENLRLLSWEGLDGYEARAREAIVWLEKAASLNPFDAYAPLRLGMTLHWIQQRDHAAKAFDRALTLGPNDVQIANHCAWDLMLRGDTRRARELLEASLRWWPWGNWMAQHYLEALNRAGITNAPPAKP